MKWITYTLSIITILCTPFNAAKAAEYTATDIITITKGAGEILLRYYGQDVGTDYKSDHSPVTKADLASNSYITAALYALTPSIPVISEETANKENIGDVFWILDPMDGTKSFIKQTGQFTVNIALIKDKTPVFGVVYIPLTDTTYFTGDDGKAYKDTPQHGTQQINVRQTANKGLTLVASRLHGSAADDAFIKSHSIAAFKTMSSSIKFCLVAEGAADIYPRNGTTMEWDSAAGHAVLRAAGGRIIAQDTMQDLRYNKPAYRNPHFIAFGKIENYP
jgi:3'(2'), 5'-bisphosphate nucleotidase|tara:strand:+ start:33539 stop:34369 length:831 start_codon:yes stop_codon:yes gene_type:complete